MKKNNSKELSIIGIVGVPAKYGGFETMIDHFVDFRKDHNIRIFCSSYDYPSKVKYYKNAKLYYINLKANGWQSLFYDALALYRSTNSDTVLLLGVSGGWFLPLFKVISRAKIVTNIDGLEWRRNKWSLLIRKWLKLLERVAVKYSDVVVVDNEALLEDYIRNHTKYRDKAKVIAYGGDHVSEARSFNQRGDYCFSVCRIEPENNVHVVLNAFQKNGLELIIVGNWNNSDYGKDLKKEYGDLKNISLLDPIYNILELDKLRSSAKWYIHGHSAGGTNPSLVEAMWLNLSVLAFDCPYNRSTLNNYGLFFKTSEDLIELLDGTGENVRRELTRDVGLLAEKKYKWEKIIELYYELF